MINIIKEVDLSYYINDDCIKRMLIARENNEEKALEMWKKWLVKQYYIQDWRQDYKPDKIAEESILRELKTGKAFLHGFDREGRPCIVIKSALHFPDKSEFEEAYRFGIFIIEKASKLADE